MTADLAHLWVQIERELRRAMPETTYAMWFGQVRPTSLEGSTLVAEAPAGLYRRINDRFGRLLHSCAAAVLGEGAHLEIVQAGRDVPRETPARVGGPTSVSSLNPALTFDSFVIGDTNRFAHAAALSVAEQPGQAYNPLFIYGPPGVGKTHLLHAVGNYVQTCGGGLSVRYTTVEAFTNQFIAAVHGGDIHAFKARFRHADLLLIDDVQFLESKAKTEEEFFHTFNALQETGSQLVLTSDRLPRDLDALHDRLRERFEAGLLIDIQPPDLETRMAVLRKRAAHDGLTQLDEDVLVAIAERITTNMRTLEGALIRVVAYGSLTGQPLTASVADKVLDDLYPTAARAAARLDLEAIQDVVCRACSVSREELLSPSRQARLVWPRQLAMFLAREHTDLTLPAIGKRFGGRNHTTVMHAIRRAGQRIQADPDALDDVRRVTEALRGAGADRPD